MATLYVQAVNHKLYHNNYFSNLTDDEKDFIYYKVHGQSKPDKNWKQFIIEQPRIRLQLTDYLFNLIKDEMFFDNYHDIKFKKVSNKEFHDRLKKTECQKFRFYYQDRWITYYFNLKSKHKVMESDLPVALAVYSGFPIKGLNNFLLKPCTFEGSEGFVECWSYQWVICTWLDFDESEDYCSLSPKLCFIPPVKLKFENYFYTLPGQNDYLLEAYTIDYDKGIYPFKPTEYYILDREGDYFKKATTNINEFKKMVLKRFNENPDRIEMFHDGSKIIAYKTSKKFETFEDMFKYLGRSWVGRHNAFFLQWNNYIFSFNAAKDGFYCPSSHQSYIDSITTDRPPPSPYYDLTFFQEASDTLIQEKIEGYEPRDWSIQILDDIKILTMKEYLKFTIRSDKWLESLDINGDTLRDFDKYAVSHYQILDAY